MIVWYMVSGTLAGLAAWTYLVRFLIKTRGTVLRSLTGVALVTMASALALMFTFVGFNLWMTVLSGSANYPGRVWIGTGLFTLLAIAVTLIWIAFERAQKK